MLINNNIKILQGDASLTRVYQGETIVWEPQTTGATVIHYRTYNDRIATLDTGSTWYSSIVSHTYEGGIGTITFNGVQTTYYKLFRNSDDLTYLEIPETITHIADGALTNIGSVYHDGAQIVSFAHTAPTLGNNVWGGYLTGTKLTSFEYPDDADYLSWYLPGYTTGGTEEYDPSDHYNSILRVLPVTTQMPPQFIFHAYVYRVYSPSRIVGWDGNYIGDLYVGDEDDGRHFYLFDKKIINVPEDAFYNWNNIVGATASMLVFPDCVKTIGSNAFYGAKINRMPRFRGVTTLGDWALRTDSFSIIDLPSGLTSVGAYCFPSGTTRINAYGAQPTRGTFDIHTADGVLDYNAAYYYTNWINGLPSSWTKRAIDMTLWPNLREGAIYVHATGNTLTLDLSLYDSTESWENGDFYISGGTYSGTLFGQVSYYDQRKTLTVSVQSGVDYIIYEYNGGCIGYSINGFTGGDILYVNENRIYGIGGGVDTSKVRMTKNGDAFYYNNEFRYGF